MLNWFSLILIVPQLIPFSSVSSWLLVLPLPLLVVVKEHVRLVPLVVDLEVYQILVQIFHLQSQL
jgi:hypothetical protein